MSPAIRQRIIEAREQTAQQWWDEAVRYDNIAAACGPHDPAFEMMVRNRDHCLNMGCLAENDA